MLDEPEKKNRQPLSETEGFLENENANYGRLTDTANIYIYFFQKKN